jgi:DNA polymerase-3 subunit beta
MRITVHKERFARALGFVERITSRNATLPILSNILLKTENGRLRVSATNLEIGVSSFIGAQIESEGQIAIPGKTLSDFVRSAPGDTVLLEVKQNTLSIKAGSYSTTMLGFDASEYPIIPKIEHGQQYIIPVNILAQLISTISDSVAVSDSRPELAGAFLRFNDTEIVMAATDIFRLAERRIPLTNTSTCSIIIPRGTVMELQRIITGIEGDITIKISDNQVLFSHDEFDIVSRLIDGKYPDYKKVIPERSLAKVLVCKDEIERAAKVASLFSSSISDVKIECDAESLRISGKNSSKGEATAGVEANLKGDPFEVSMNYHYFLDGLKTIQTEKVVLEFTGKGSPFVMRPHTDEREVTYLIMPLRS